MTFGTRLRQTRQDKRLTLEALGKGLGTEGKDASKTVVSGWEKNKHFPRVDQLAMICERLGCGADYLLFDKPGQAQATPAWPFAKVIPVARLQALSDADKGYVQRRLLQAIEECEPPPEDPLITYGDNTPPLRANKKPQKKKA